MSPPPSRDIYAETLAVFDSRDDPHEPRTTPEVADALDANRRTVYKRLKTLADRGDLETKAAGAHARVWWRPPADRPQTPFRDQEFRSLVGAVEEYAIFTLDADGNVVTWNKGARRIKGYERDEIVGEHISKFYTDEAVEDEIHKRNLETAEAEGSTEGEGWRLRKDGSRFWANVTITAVHDDHGDLQGYVKVTRDMTDRRNYERRLERQRDTLQDELDDIYERIDDAVYALDEEWRFTHVNERAERLLGRPEEELLGTVVWEEFPQAVERNVYHHYQEAMETQESAQFEEYFQSHDRWYEVRAYPSETGLSVHFLDVTDRKEREKALERYETVVETITDGVYVADEQHRFAMVNDAYVEMTDYEREDLLGNHISTVVDEDAVEVGERRRNRLRTGDDDVGSVELEIETADGEHLTVETRYALLAYDDEFQGTVGVVRDVTERRERERALEASERRYRTLAENVPNGIVALFDGDLRYTLVAGQLLNEFDLDPDEVVGKAVGEQIVQTDIGERILAGARSALEGESHELEFEYEDRIFEASILPVTGADGTVLSGMIMTQETTERVERERDLEVSRRRLKTLVEHFPNGAVTLVDDDLRYVTVGGTPIGEDDPTIDELEGQLLSESLPQELADILLPRYEAAFEGDSCSFEEAVGDHVYQFRIVPVRDDAGTVVAAMGMSQDITDRKEYEQELEKRVRQQEVVANLGQHALAYRDVDTLLADAADLVAETLGTDYCKVLDLDADAGELLLRQGVGWDDGIVGSATVSATENDSQAGHTLATQHPVVVEDLETEARFSGPELLTGHDVRSGISTIIGPHDDPWGILGTHDTDCRAFSDRDVTFFQSVANILATAIARHEDERELARQRNQLAAMDNLNEVVRGVTDAVIERSTREEIELAVCEELAAAQSYRCAWIADVDRGTEKIVPRVEAGTDGALETVEFSATPEDANGHDPVAEAFRTGEMTVTRDTFEDVAFEPWRHTAEEYGIRSLAAIPIKYEGTLFGLIGVCSRRVDAFDGGERAVVGQLGEIVGHAIAGVERKQALLSDTVTEVGFHVREFYETIGVPVSPEGTIAVDRVVSIGNGEFLVYGTATGDTMNVVNALVDAESPSFVESVTVLGSSTGDGTPFELMLTEAPLLSTITAHGGYLHEATVEEGDCSVTIHLAPSADVQRVIEQFTDTYPNAEMVTRRQTTRPNRPPKQIMQILSSRLTDRQQAALEASYFAGFFECPRDRSGEDIAASLGISSSTFHQHIRKAEKKLLDVVFATT